MPDTRTLKQRLTDVQKLKYGEAGAKNSPYVVYSSDTNITPQEIASKLNSLPKALGAHTIKDLPSITAKEIIQELKSLKGNDRIDISNIRNGEQLSRISQRIDMNDMRWHGGGSSSNAYTPGGTDVPIIDGGTGLSSISAKSIWAANSANILVELSPAAGQSVRINAAGTAWEVYTPIPTGGLTFSEVTGTTQAMAVNSWYLANNAGLVTLTLPDTAALGSVVKITGKGAGLFRIAQNAGENINFGNVTTTTGVGGYIEATLRYDTIELICSVANTTWTVSTPPQGNITYV